MLKIMQAATPYEANVEVKEYVPFSITWEDYSIPLVIYWRSGDLKTSLLEIGISPGSKRITNANLVLANKHSLILGEFKSIAPRQIGIPTCDISPWQSSLRIIDDPMNLTVYLSTHSVSVVLGDSFQINTIFVSDRVSFGIDTLGALRTLQLTNLTIGEKALLDMYFELI